MARYSFLTTWLLDCERERAWEAIYAQERWPEWWRGVEVADELHPGDGDRVGSAAVADRPGGLGRERDEEDGSEQRSERFHSRQSLAMGGEVSALQLAIRARELLYRCVFASLAGSAAPCQ